MLASRLTFLMATLAGLAILVASSPAGAATMTWYGGTGNWCSAAGWDPHEVPDAADETAVLGGSGPYTVILDCQVFPGQVDLANQAATLYLNGTWMGVGAGGMLSNHGTIDAAPGQAMLTGTIVNQPGARILVRSDTMFRFGGDLLRNDGDILVNSDQLPAAANFLLDDGDGMTLAGTGRLILQGGDDPERAVIGSWQGTAWTQAGGHTILGEGVIAAPLVNEGLVSSRTAGKVLRIRDLWKTNRALLEARDGGILEIVSTNLTQEQVGTILADGGTVRITSAQIAGGEISTANGGLVEIEPGVTSLVDVHLSGLLHVLGGCRVVAGRNSWVNDGTLILNPQRQPDDAVLQGVAYNNSMLGGTGQIVMRTAGDPNDARIETTGETLINGPLHTIRGEGLISCSFENRGKIRADEPDRPLRLWGGVKVNLGDTEASAGGILELEDTWFDQRGGGSLTADGGTVRLLSGCRVQGGLLRTQNGGRIVAQSAVSALSDVTNQGEVDVMDGAVLVAGYSLITNDGTILVNPDRQSDAAIIRGEPYNNVTFGGGGQLVLRTAGDPNTARLETTGETMINGPSHLIRGTGAITCAFNNHGRVSADEAGGVLRLSGGAMTNDATLEAHSAGILELSGAMLEQSGPGTVLADSAQVQMHGSRITHGALHTIRGGRIQSSSGVNGLLEVTNNGELEILGGTRLHVGWGTLTNNGTITVNPREQPEDAVVCGWDYCNVSFLGTGQLVLRTAGDPADARIETLGWYVVNGPQHTIRGEGGIYTTLQNNGRVEADVPGRALVGGGQLTNAGTSAASGGGRLDVPAPFINQGIAEARTGGAARFGNVGPNYGNGTLHGGAWRVYANSTMRLIGADIRTLAADLLLDGADSRLLLDDAGGDAIALLSQVAVDGRLEVRNGRALQPGGALRVDGTVVVGPGGSLAVPAEYAQYGDSLAGRTTVDGLLAATAGAIVHGGVLDGIGTVNGDLTNHGRIEPGHSAGQLTIDGEFAQDEAGTLVIELAGAGPDQHDRLAVSGAAVLGGRLVVRATGGYLPQNGASFIVITCAARTLEFDSVVSEVGDGRTAQVLYGPTSVTVVISAPAGIEEPEAPAVEPPADPGSAASSPASVQLAVRLGSEGPIVALDLPSASEVRLNCFDLLGRSVACLADRSLAAGTHEWRWAGRGVDGRALSSGVYFVRAEIRGPQGTAIRQARIPLVR